MNGFFGEPAPAQVGQVFTDQPVEVEAAILEAVQARPPETSSSIPFWISPTRASRIPGRDLRPSAPSSPRHRWSSCSIADCRKWFDAYVEGWCSAAQDRAILILSWRWKMRPSPHRTCGDGSG